MTERISSTGSTDDASRSGGGVPDAALGLATVEILGLPIVRAGRDDVLGALSAHLGSGHPLRIAYVNAHTATLAARDRAFHECLRAYDVLLNDGVGIAIAAALAGSPVVENLNGSDFTVPLLELFAERGLSVFLYGARPGVAEVAASRLVARIPRLRIAGIAHGYGPDPADVVAEIARCGAEVVVVALGNPLQETWIVSHLDATGARCAVAVGAFLDFTAGVVPRAPRWLNRLGGEWLFRLVQEPRRLARRYLIGIPVFLWLLLRARR